MPYIRLLEIKDAAQLADYYERNEEFHRPWSPLPPPNAFTKQFHEERLITYARLHKLGAEYRYGIFDESHDLLVGSIALTSVERGVFQNGRFGYSIDKEYTGKGMMTAGLREVVEYSFSVLLLHRLEANIMPHNIASRRVLEKCGFAKIGHSPKMICINGQWEDHEMYMILAEIIPQ